MTKDEALKIALETLEYWDVHGKLHQPTEEAITAIKEALAQPEQEPVAWLHRQGNFTEASMNPLHDDEIDRGWTQEPLYTTPPQRKPLTDEQIDEEFKLYASQFDTSSDKWLDMGADDYFKAGFKAAYGIKENT